MTNPIPSSATPAAGTEAAARLKQIRDRVLRRGLHTSGDMELVLAQLDAANETLAKQTKALNTVGWSIDKFATENDCIPTFVGLLSFIEDTLAAAGTDTQEKA